MPDAVLARPATSTAPAAAAPLRVLQVVTSMCAGGLSRYVVNLLASADPARVEMHLVCTHTEGPEIGAARGQAASVTVFAGRSQWDKVRRLTALMRQLKPHVVQAHQEPSGLVAAALAGVPRRLDTVHMAEYWLVDGHPWLRWWAARSATAHVVCTLAEGDRIRPATRGGRLCVVPPGQELERVTHEDRVRARTELGIPSEAFVFGTVARLSAEKGVGYLLEAAPQVLAARPGSLLLVIGDGAEAASLPTRVEHLGIADRVLFTGHRSDAGKLLGAFDVFVMPSLTESWGFAVAEAMGAGIPVVSTDTAGPSSFIRPGETGVLVPRRDSSAIASAVSRLAADPVERARLGSRGAEDIRRVVSAERFAAEYERLYGLAPREEAP